MEMKTKSEFPSEIIFKKNVHLFWVEKSNSGILQTEGSMALFYTTLGIVIRSNSQITIEHEKCSPAVSLPVRHPSFCKSLLPLFTFILLFK